MENTNIHQVKLKISCYNRDSNWFVRVCCHNAVGLVLTVQQIPRPNGLGISLSVSHTPPWLWEQTPSETVSTHWGRVTHLCIIELNIIGSDNGWSPGQCQTIIWTNAGVLSIEPLRTNFSEILIKVHTFSFKKMRLKVSAAKWQPFWLGLNVLSYTIWLITVSYVHHILQFFHQVKFCDFTTSFGDV